MPTIVQIDGWDPVAAAPVSLLAASHDDPSVCHLGGATWWPAIAKLPALRYDLFDGAFTAQITAPSSTISLQTEPWPAFGRYILADARFRLWHGTLGDPIGAYVLRFDGRVSSQPKIQDGRAEIDFAVDDRWLDTALLALYAGTGGAEGPAALKGQAKPLALGAPRYVSGKLVDTVNSVFQVSAYGTVNAFEAALERLARYPAPIADYPTYAALVAAAIPAGQWATARAVGMARFGAPPTGQISFLLQGDAAGTDGWARKPGQLIRRLAILSGGAGKIDDASLNALDAVRPYNLSLYLDAQTTARDLIQKLAASVNAVAGVSWTGQLFVVPVAVGATTTVLAADGSSLPAVSTVQQIDIASPYQKLAIGAERAWTVHALADIAFTATVVDLGLYAASTPYREGNIVNLSDGSRWLFTAITPATGSAPAAGNANWQMLTGPTAAVYGDGTSIEVLKPAQAGADKTSANTAAAIQAQGFFATQSYADWLTRVTGTGKPENNATFSENLIRNAGLTNDASEWQFGAGAARIAAAAGDPLKAYISLPPGKDVFANANSGVPMPLAGATTLYVSSLFYAVNTAGSALINIYWYGADGSNVATSQLPISFASQSAWNRQSFTVARPANAVAYVAQYLANTTAGALYVGELRVALMQSAATLGADVSANIFDGSAGNVTLTRQQLITLLGTAAALVNQSPFATSTDYGFLSALPVFLSDLASDSGGNRNLLQAGYIARTSNDGAGGPTLYQYFPATPGSDKTANATAAAIAYQGAFATQSSATGDQIVGGRIKSPDGNVSWDLADASGRQTVIKGTQRLVRGSGFGTNSDLVEWLGPNAVAVGSETQANGNFALTTSGAIVQNVVPTGTGATSAQPTSTIKIGVGTSGLISRSLKPGASTSFSAQLRFLTNSQAGTGKLSLQAGVGGNFAEIAADSEPVGPDGPSTATAQGSYTNSTNQTVVVDIRTVVTAPSGATPDGGASFLTA